MRGGEDVERLDVRDRPAFYGSSYPGGGFLNSDFTTPNIITATLGAPATALALDFGGLFGAPVSFTFNFSDGSSLSASSLQSITGTNSLAFIGFTSTVAITSLSLVMPDSPNYNAIDNFRFGRAVIAAVPEPASLALVGIALSACAWVSRRRGTKAHQAPIAS